MANRQPKPLVLIAAILGVPLVGVSTLLYFSLGEWSRSQRCVAGKQVLIAIDEYCALHKRSPLFTKDEDGILPEISWRFQIASMLESAGGRDPRIQAGHDWRSQIYAPWARRGPAAMDYKGTGATNWFAIIGAETIFSRANQLEGVDALPSELALLIDVPHSSYPWLRPGDIDLAKYSKTPDMTLGQALEGLAAKGQPGILFADGVLIVVREETPLSILEELSTLSRDPKVDRESLLKNYLVWKSE